MLREEGLRRVSVRDRRTPVDGVVRIGPLMSIPAVLAEFGCEPGPVLDSVGLKPIQFEDPDVKILYVTGSKLLARCVAATGCRHFGLLVGERASPSSLGIAGFMLRSAPDVGAALRALVRHLDLHDQGGVPTLVTGGSVTLLGYAIYQPGVEAAEQIYDLSMAVACNIMRVLCGASWSPTEVLLSRRPPRDSAPYRRFFRAPLRFGQDQSAMVFPTPWLDHRLPTADPHLHRHLEREARERHAQEDANLVGALRRLLRQCLATQECSITDVAKQLDMHERTLNRRLQAEGTTFRRELEEIRYGMARRFLTESAAPLAEIATALGYADASAFSRAFKRWSKITPAQWRSRNARP
jgi:AraC-like DNA-binding protein